MFSRRLQDSRCKGRPRCATHLPAGKYSLTVEGDIVGEPGERTLRTGRGTSRQRRSNLKSRRLQGPLPNAPAASAPATQPRIPPVVAAKSQEKARKLAQDSDLPAIAKADRVELVFSEPGKNPKTIKVNDPAKLKALRQALLITDANPSAGMEYIPPRLLPR